MVVMVGVAQAHNRLSELIDLALGGEEVVVTKRGVPVVRLVPAVPHDEDRRDWASMTKEMERRLASRGGSTDAEIAAFLAEEDASSDRRDAVIEEAWRAS
jgi:prevent-host-death family protein